MALFVVVSIVVVTINPDSAIGRYLTTSIQSSTFLGRLLYFQDALPVIAKHPLGLGYMGYYGTQGSFQTGVYSVMFVHNELLQLLMDVGWLPSLAVAAACIRSFFAKGGSLRKRLLLIAILGHSMFDFDLQFLAMWFLLLPLLEIYEGKSVFLCMKRGKKKRGWIISAAACGILAVFSLWLGMSDFAYINGNDGICLKLTPFHTAALTQKMTKTEDMDELEQIADQILNLNAHVSLAYSAKANAAVASGDIEKMMREKETAISCARYSLEEYCDYFDKLYEAMLVYQRSGDTGSAAVCREKLLDIPDMLLKIKMETSPLAWKIADKPELELPEEYQKILQYLAESDVTSGG